MRWRNGGVGALLIGLVTVGCASSDGSDNADSLGDDAEALRSTCRHYSAFFADRSCPVVRGTRGRWEPGALFDAPDDVQATSCGYTWIGSGRPDAKALVAATRDAETNLRIGAVAPQCGAAAEPAVVDPLPEGEDPFPIHVHVGSVGCDVCGVVKKGTGFIVIPPELPGGRGFPVDLSNGKVLRFVLPPAKAGAMVVHLPAPPPGTTYRDGPLHLE